MFGLSISDPLADPTVALCRRAVDICIGGDLRLCISPPMRQISIDQIEAARLDRRRFFGAPTLRSASGDSADAGADDDPHGDLVFPGL